MDDNKYNLITTKLVPVLVIGLAIATVSVAVEKCFFDGQDVHSYMLFVLYAAFNLLVGIATIAGFIDYVLNSLETRAIINPTDPVGRKRKVILYMCGIIILLWTGLCITYSLDSSDCDDGTTSPPSAPPMEIFQTERDILLSFFSGANGINWENNENWNESKISICEWFGVSCSQSGQVTELKLKGNNMFGTIATEIGLLTALLYIDFDSNSLSGSIPSELGNLDSLRHLELDSNRLTSTVPSELGSLNDLKEVYLQENNLSGDMPEELCARRDYLGGELDTLIADCEGGGNEFGGEDIICSCCTTCLRRKT